MTSSPHSFDNSAACSSLRRLESAAENVVTPIDGCAIHWRLWGQGPLVVLLHGNGGSWSHWVRNIEFLARDYRVAAVDIPGFGDSDMPPEPYSADSIAALLRKGLKDFSGANAGSRIVGFSFGSSVAGALARQLGPDAHSLVVVSAGHLRLSKASIPPFRSWRKLADPDQRREAHRHNLEVMMISRPERIDDLAIEIQSRNTAKVRLVGEKVTGSHPLRSDLESLSCPFFGIWGSEDRTIGPFMPERLELFAALGRAGHARVIPDAGHWHPYEAAEAFNETLADVLQNRRGK